jgi:NAD(P)-dependent dehydrogenase (short-subunit alcohol dehydrogenase family)
VVIFTQVGVQLPRGIAEADFGEFSRFLRIHVEGTFLLVRSASAAMQRQELKPIDPASPGRGGTRGAIVTLGSGNSFAAAPHLVQYTAAKHAVLGVTKNAGMFYVRPASGIYPIWEFPTDSRGLCNV